MLGFGAGSILPGNGYGSTITLPPALILNAGVMPTFLISRDKGDFPSINGHVLFGGNGDIGSQLSLLRITSGYSVPSGEECCSRQQVERSMSKWVFGAGAVICWLGIFVFPPHRMDRQLIGVALFVGGWFVMALSGSIGFRLFGLSLGRPFFVGATFSRLRFGRDSTPVSRAQFQTDPQPPPGSGSAGLFFQLIRPA
jgi:hypothetical protein